MTASTSGNRPVDVTGLPSQLASLVNKGDLSEKVKSQIQTAVGSRDVQVACFLYATKHHNEIENRNNKVLTYIFEEAHKRGAPEPDLKGLPESLKNIVNNREWNDQSKVMKELRNPDVRKAYDAWKKSHQYELTFDAFSSIEKIKNKL